CSVRPLPIRLFRRWSPWIVIGSDPAGLGAPQEQSSCAFGIGRTEQSRKVRPLRVPEDEGAIAARRIPPGFAPGKGSSGMASDAALAPVEARGRAFDDDIGAAAGGRRSVSPAAGLPAAAPAPAASAPREAPREAARKDAAS